MTLTINSGRTQFSILSSLLNSFIGSPSSYTKIEIKIFQNTTETSTIKTYTSVSPITSSTDVATIAGLEYINPSFLGATEFVQGVYNVIVILTSVSGIQTDEGCIYVENGLKCDVDEYLLNSSVNILERVLAGLKYQSLISSEECPCKCDKKIKIYNSLIDINNTCQGC